MNPERSRLAVAVFNMKFYRPTLLNTLWLLHVSGMRDYPTGLRSRIVAALNKAQPLTPALYQELLKLEQRLPIEPYGAIISTPAPHRASCTTTLEPEETDEKDEIDLPRRTNQGAQFTNKPYMRTLVAFSLVFGGGYLYLPVSFLWQ